MRSEQEIRRELQEVLRDTPEDYARIFVLLVSPIVMDTMH